MNLEKYLDYVIETDLDKNFWFMTKQTMSDYYFPFYVGRIVETFATKHKPNQNFADYYVQCFKENPETKELYPKQTESENTYRNAIIAEFLGLIDRQDSQYAHATVTPAYLRLKKYVDKFADIEKNRPIVDRQIEKICLNVIRSRKYKDVKDITVFPIIFLYKILVGLYEKYRDSKLTYEEFSLFVMRAHSYSQYEDVMNLIEQYRKHEYSSEYEKKIHEVLSHQSTTNVRFDALIGSLIHIEYVKNEYYRIANNQESFDYLRDTVRLYEGSKIAQVHEKQALKEFMQSASYFKGEIDNVAYIKTVSEEDFIQLIEVEDDFQKKIDTLAEKYGESGTTEVTHEVRLASVQQAFRDKLIERHGQQCLMCKVTNRELLVASHIKDAAKCNIHEKADFNNGLLLCANHDRLFDRSLITFNFYDGKIQISESLTEEEKEICMLDESYCLPETILTPERVDYLMWHNDEFHKKEVER